MIVKKEESWFSQRKFLISLLAIVLTIIVGILFYSFFVKPIHCADAECYKTALLTCNRALFTHDDSEAVWSYIIRKPVDSEACQVDTTLLYIKEGKTDLESLQGETMICTVLKSSVNFPEKDITRCTGKLKEDIQDVIIQRMHNYLLGNLGTIEDEFKVV